MKSILVVGGSRGIGNWLTINLFTKLGDISTITVLDIVQPNKNIKC